MADMLLMPDGSVQTVFSMDDFLELADQYMGMDAKRWLSGQLDATDEDQEYAEELEKELQEQKEHYKYEFQKLRKLSECLADIICQREIDREKLLEAAGKIGIITWEGINR